MKKYKVYYSVILTRVAEYEAESEEEVEMLANDFLDTAEYDDFDYGDETYDIEEVDPYTYMRPHIEEGNER